MLALVRVVTCLLTCVTCVACARVEQVTSCEGLVDGRLVSLVPLQRTDQTPRYLLEQNGRNYSWNPCSSYNLPADPHAGGGDQCHYVAMCESSWSPYEFFTLGIQRNARIMMKRIHYNKMSTTDEELDDLESLEEGDSDEDEDSSEEDDEESDEDDEEDSEGDDDEDSEEEEDENKGSENEDDDGLEEDGNEGSGVGEVNNKNEEEERASRSDDEYQDDASEVEQYDEVVSNGRGLGTESINANFDIEPTSESILIEPVHVDIIINSVGVSPIAEGQYEGGAEEHTQSYAYEVALNGSSKYSDRYLQDQLINDALTHPRLEVTDVMDDQPILQHTEFVLRKREKTGRRKEKRRRLRDRSESRSEGRRRERSVEIHQSADQSPDVDEEQNSKLHARVADRLVIRYRGLRSKRSHRTYVILTCAPELTKLDEGMFIFVGAQYKEQYFELRHACCCPGACEQVVLYKAVGLPGADDGSGHLWIIIPIYVSIILAAVVIGTVCCRKGGGGGGSYNMLPGCCRDERQYEAATVLYFHSSDV